MDFASVEGLNRGYNKLETTQEEINHFFTTELEINKHSELLDTEKEYLGNSYSEEKDYYLVGVQDFTQQSFELSTYFRFMATTYRFYERAGIEERFISSDWVLPIEIVKGRDRVLVTDNLLVNNTSLEDISKQLFGEVKLTSAYFSEDNKTVVYEVVENRN